MHLFKAMQGAHWQRTLWLDLQSPGEHSTRTQFAIAQFPPTASRRLALPVWRSGSLGPSGTAGAVRSARMLFRVTCMNAVVVQMQDQGATTPPKAGEAAQALELNRLLQAATQRCTVSFKRLYGLTRPRLFAIVLAINRDRVDSEDVLQEVYLKVWDNCGQFDAQKGHVVSWLSGIAHHSALDSLRRRRARSDSHRIVAPEALDPYDGLTLTAATPLENATLKELGAAFVTEPSAHDAGAPLSERRAFRAWGPTSGPHRARGAWGPRHRADFACPHGVQECPSMRRPQNSTGSGRARVAVRRIGQTVGRAGCGAHGSRCLRTSGRQVCWQVS